MEVVMGGVGETSLMNENLYSDAGRWINTTCRLLPARVLLYVLYNSNDKYKDTYAYVLNVKSKCKQTP